MSLLDSPSPLQKEEALSEAQLDARIARREAKRSEEGEAALKGRLGEASQELEVLRKAEGELRTRVAQLQAALQREERQAATAKLGYEVRCPRHLRDEALPPQTSSLPHICHSPSLLGLGAQRAVPSRRAGDPTDYSGLAIIQPRIFHNSG